jgi:hypothetical protein
MTIRLSNSRIWVALAIVVSLALSSSNVTAAAPSRPAKLSMHDLQLLANARAENKSVVTLLIAAKPGANSTVATGVQSLGGTIRYREDTLDYLRVTVPVSKVEAVAQLPGVQSVSLDEIIPLTDPVPAPAANPVQVAPPDNTTPPVNAYMPTRDVGSPQFVAANPTYDGRGVVVGILDTGVTLDHPSLATTTTGARKIVDWVTFTDPVTDDDPTWVNMQDQVTAAGGVLTYKGVTYVAPANGTYRIGLFNERDSRLNSAELGSDVNRDGNPPGSDGLFAVLWNTTTNVVWVDANQNHSFADEPGLTDYKVKYDIGYFGTDNPATPVAERMPFVVQTDGKNKFVNIGIVSESHGSHVAGIVAANHLFGGNATGAAPGAQIVSVRVCLFIAGCTAHAMIEGMIYATKQANVDVINMSIGGLPALNDGNNTRAILYNRLIDKTKTQMFISAGNDGPGINTVGDPSVATDVVSVGAYVHKDTWLNNYGAVADKIDGLFVFSSRGPREDGGFKPQIVAPGAAVSTTPMWLSGSPVAGTYALPPGYSMFNGTSMASPQAAGAAALLVSAAKQAGAQYKPDQLRQAIMSSARYLPAYGAHEQGMGLMDVGGAWTLLKTNIKTTAIASSAPVDTIISQFLLVPDSGPGIYQREGWHPADSDTRTILLTRTTGGSKAVSYNLSWIGNDGTFSAPASVALPLNQPVAVPVQVVAATPGVHSAILNVDDPDTMGIDYQVMNAVVAVADFNAAGNFAVSYNGTADRPDMATFFFRVPTATPAFQVNETTTNGGRVRVMRFHPYGVGLDNSTAAYQTGGSQSRTTSNPLGGVWEVTVDTSRTSPVSPSMFTLAGSILGASVAPNPDIIPSATIGVPVARSYTITNLYGAFTGRGVGTTLGSAYIANPSISTGQQTIFDVTVLAGSTRLSATIGSPSDLGADLDLFVYNCTTGSCVLAGQSAGGSAEEAVSIANPAAGLWKVLVDGFAVPAGTTTYHYLDVFANPAFGSVSVTDANALRPAGASWTVPGSVTANAAPAAGRVLRGTVEVRTSGNVLVGTGEVFVQSVTP